MRNVACFFLFTKYKLKSYISSLVAKSDMQNKFCVILRLVVAVILNKSLTCRQVNTTAVWQYHRDSAFAYLSLFCQIPIDRRKSFTYKVFVCFREVFTAEKSVVGGKWGRVRAL